MSSSGFSFSAALSAAQSTKDDNKKSVAKVSAAPSFSISGALAATAKKTAEVTTTAEAKKSINANQLLLNADEWQRGEVQLRCTEKWHETHDVVSFRFQGLTPVKFNYKPGQFITFKLEIEGEIVYRSYTMSSSPSRPYSIVVTVKRIAGGKVSNFLADKVNQGDIITLVGPDGAFNLVDIAAEKYLFLSAGSGITPMYSMSRWLLDTKVGSDIAFVHSARTDEDIIFADSLGAMAYRSAQFQLSYLLENADELVEGVNHTGNDSRMLGRIDIEKLQALVPDFMTRTIFVCGPEPYMVSVKSLIETSGFEMKNFHQESFTGAVKSPPSSTNTAATTSNFMLSIKDKKVALSAEQTLLDGIESEGLPIIAACRSGVCGACKCQVTSGTTESSSTMTLTAEEIAAGYVLACSTKITSDVSLKM
ncbi:MULTISPECIES: hybrid-cluster NAD(P)-dependent oxidoreductase [unclassified Shewanella]|uniref:hybrid-cluster NAD(P)-dependent oxidoreductase n=1 Tax=unclassified Shewanella TaxID=196818 RepID=UPI000C86466D|nr:MULTISPECIES: hybrid-cluster NAD(P)-dependent oxidoreductase [unclassified Shewanella]MDO6620473.1 hybrid-cluster NAD(P)-dependent oxidoreductase [Shewanella sp. 6_MG-2023]MDO6679610.1 hybrid-cluster NAD(P)-dependent oxidoreductase [Shewanella sp. 4_MG-2023]MDO6776571.1 hybrid-cluster NAD(P)-dependent oxidoreductase [Shewanella sp. 3_MG-2023]